MSILTEQSLRRGVTFRTCRRQDAMEKVEYVKATHLIADSCVLLGSSIESVGNKMGKNISFKYI